MPRIFSARDRQSLRVEIQFRRLTIEILRERINSVSRVSEHKVARAEPLPRLSHNGLHAIAKPGCDRATPPPRHDHCSSPATRRVHIGFASVRGASGSSFRSHSAIHSANTACTSSSPTPLPSKERARSVVALIEREIIHTKTLLDLRHQLTQGQDGACLIAELRLMASLLCTRHQIFTTVLAIKCLAVCQGLLKHSSRLFMATRIVKYGSLAQHEDYTKLALLPFQFAYQIEGAER